MQLTEQQLNELMAEMRGWKLEKWNGDGTLCHREKRPDGDCCTSFTPTTDANQALECLEAWLSKERDYETTKGDFQRHSVSLMEEYTIEGTSLTDWSCLAEVEHKSLATATCLALASARKGVTVTIKEGE